MNQISDTASSALLAGEAAFDPIEERLRANVRATIEAVFEEELDSFLSRLRYSRGDGAAKGYRHGHRERQLTGTFGTETVRVPRARIEDDAGKVTEWRSKALPRYQRLTKKAEALIAAVYLSGTNTRRVKRALFGLFEGAVSKDLVSRAWRKVKVDWDAWCARSLADEDIVRLIFDGTVIKTPLDQYGYSWFASKPLPGSGCARSMAGKPFLSPSNRCPLTSPPDEPNLHKPGALPGNFHSIRDTTRVREFLKSVSGNLRNPQVEHHAPDPTPGQWSHRHRAGYFLRPGIWPYDRPLARSRLLCAPSSRP